MRYDFILSQSIKLKMPTCGYACPQCEGRGFNDEGEVCDWCGEKKEEKNDSDDEEDTN